MSRKAPEHPASSFLDDYHAGKLNDFFELVPGDMSSALRLPRPVDRPRLAGVMRAHARRLGAPEAVERSLQRLEHPEARVVVAGQQTGLLLGPGYTLSKAVSAIALARSVDRDDRPVLPVFWLASQDHDSAEIDHAYLLDERERLHRVDVDLPVDVAAGRLAFDPAMLRAVDAALDALEPRSAHDAEVRALLHAAAERASSYSDWFASQLYRLLGGHGLLLFDPMDEPAAELMRGVLEREIASPEVSVAAVNGAARRLRTLGYEPQLGRGAQATNLFLEDDSGPLPRRVLLRHEGHAFRLEGRVLSAADVRVRMRADPRSLTPAAGLRPIVQDAVLPTAAVVLGPGELRYFSQLRDVYRHHEVAMPLVWPRSQITVVEPPAARILDKFGLGVARFQADPHARLAEVVLRRSGHGERFGRAADELETLMRTLLKEVSDIDPTLAGTVERGHYHLGTTLGLLRGKTAAALERHDEITRRQFARLEAHLLPLGQPSERVLSPYSHMLKFGVAPVVRCLLELPAAGVHELRI